MNVESEYRRINTRDIHVDPMYQRDLDSKRVSKMAQKYNPLLVNPIKVSFRDGKYFVFDGQHTLSLIKVMNNGNDVLADCKVFYGLTRLDEMNLFISQTGDSSPVKIGDKCRALYNSGDPEVTNMIRLVEQSGLSVGFKPYKAMNRVVSIGTLVKYYKTMDKIDFLNSLIVIKKSWDGIPESLGKEILSGMFKLFSICGEEINIKRLISKLQKENPVVIIRDGKITLATGDGRYARAILGIYNKGASSGRIEDKF